MNDGCNEKETILWLQIIKSLFPSQIFVLEKRNEGLASARNHAITWLQKKFGENDQIYLTFLDADDHLDRDFFDKLKLNLRNDSRSKYFYFPNIEFFGTISYVSQTEFDPFAQLQSNKLPYAITVRLSDIINCSYRENPISELKWPEDWDFSNQLISQNFIGVHIDTKLFYRKRGISMYTDVQNNFNLLRKYIAQENKVIWDMESITKKILSIEGNTLIKVESLERYQDFKPIYLEKKQSNDSKKVLILQNDLYQDESQLLIAPFIKELREWDVNVDLIVNDPHLNPLFTPKSIYCLDNDIDRYLHLIMKIANSYSAVILNNWKYSSKFLEVASQYNLRNIHVMCHTLTIEKEDNANCDLTDIIKSFDSMIKKYLCTSHSLSNKLVGFGINKSRCVVIGTKPLYSRIYNIGNGKNVKPKSDKVKVIFAGEKSYLNGFDRFLNIAGKFRFNTNFEFYFLGQRSYKNIGYRLFYRVKCIKEFKSSLYEKILIPGFDLILIPTRIAASPLVLHSAQINNTSVIATSVGDIPESFNHLGLEGDLIDVNGKSERKIIIEFCQLITRFSTNSEATTKSPTRKQKYASIRELIFN